MSACWFTGHKYQNKHVSSVDHRIIDLCIKCFKVHRDSWHKFGDKRDATEYSQMLRDRY